MISEKFGIPYEFNIPGSSYLLDRAPHRLWVALDHPQPHARRPLGHPPALLLVDQIQRLVPAAHRGDDLVGIGGPDERLGLPVGLGEEAVDGGLQVDDRGEHAAFQPAVGELGEEALDGIQPGGRGRA